LAKSCPAKKKINLIAKNGYFPTIREVDESKEK
jgi:hypothetical protein